MKSNFTHRKKKKNLFKYNYDFENVTQSDDSPCRQILCEFIEPDSSFTIGELLNTDAITLGEAAGDAVGFVDGLVVVAWLVDGVDFIDAMLSNDCCEPAGKDDAAAAGDSATIGAKFNVSACSWNTIEAGGNGIIFCCWDNGTAIGDAVCPGAGTVVAANGLVCAGTFFGAAKDAAAAGAP